MHSTVALMTRSRASVSPLESDLVRGRPARVMVGSGLMVTTTTLRRPLSALGAYATFGIVATMLEAE